MRSTQESLVAQPQPDLFAPPPVTFQEIPYEPETLVTPGSPRQKKPQREGKKRHWVRWTLGVGVVALVAARLALPTVVKAYVNHTLDKNPNYDGHVEDVDIALIRGAYAVNGIEIVKENGAVAEPLLTADRIDLSISWSALIHGKLVGQVEMFTPVVNLVNGGTEESNQTGAEGGGDDWRVTVHELFPFQIDRLTVHDGEVHYVDHTASPVIDVALDDLQAEAQNLNNATHADGTLISTIKLTSKAQGTGGIDLFMRLDPFAENPTFDSDLRVSDVDMTRFNELIQRYGKFDLETGFMNLNLELASDEGVIAGYVKPILKDVKVTSLREVTHESPLAAAWELTVGAVKGILTNKKHDQVAARIPISGDLKSPKPATWTAIYTVVENAFVSALWDGLDHTVTFADAADAPGAKASEAAAKSKEGATSQDRETTSKQRHKDKRLKKGASTSK